MNVKLENFLPADGILLSGDRTKAEQANFNQAAGPGFTLILDGEPVCCGGIRLNVGEGWFVLSESMRARLAHPNYGPEKKAIIETCRAHLETYMRDAKLYRVYAEARIADRFCEALGFEKRDHVFVR